MRRCVLIFFIVVIVFARMVFGTWEGMNGEVVKVIEELMKEVRESRYSHENEVNEDSGRYYVDCSGLVGHIIGKIASWALEEVWDELDGYGRKRAIGYYVAINQEDGGWKKLERMEEVMEGDIIVWKELRYDARGNSGHALIVVGQTKAESMGMWKMRVMDASKYKLEEDTRESGKNGIGEGELRLKVDEEGKIVGYQRKKEGRIFEKPIVIGRLTRGEMRYLIKKLDKCPAVDIIKDLP